MSYLWNEVFLSVIRGFIPHMSQTGIIKNSVFNTFFKVYTNSVSHIFSYHKIRINTNTYFLFLNNIDLPQTSLPIFFCSRGFSFRNFQVSRSAILQQRIFGCTTWIWLGCTTDQHHPFKSGLTLLGTCAPWKVKS